jgi:2-aminoadipate transaminase
MIDYDHFFSRVAQSTQGSAIRKMGVMAVRVPDMISFAPGYPDPVTFAWREFQEITHEILGGTDPSVLQYGPTRGYRPLLASITGILGARGIEAGEDNLLITTGSQQGLDLVARALLDPGDVALVELPAYTGAITAFRNTQVTLVGVRQEADGIDLGDLEAVATRTRAAGRRVRCLYVVPNFQNPTGLLISLPKRRQLLDLAARLDLLIIEDDPYGALYFEDAATADDTRPIKADDREGRVIYLSSFSKTLAPGFRVAWITAAAPVIEKLDLGKQAADLMTPALDQRVVFEAIRRGVVDRQIPILRRCYEQKRSVMQEALRRELAGVITWPEPRGGFFLWVTLPETVNAEAMLPQAVDRRVIYVAGSAFFVDGSGHNTIRLCFSLPSEERIVEGVRRLAPVIKAAIARR